MNQFSLIKNKPTGRVRIIPINEGQEISYCEKFEGTQETILNRTREMLSGLETLLPQGTWMIKVESIDVSNSIYITNNGIFNDRFESLN
ncbi:MAG TPA: hypothetical protein PKY82_00425 [Pyrinomonadaceae bacterium]|nr:hypothetical protein [Pyrinomonadaceae bacterium]